MGNAWSLNELSELPTTKYYTEMAATLPRMDGKTVAITGCTSGTGFVLAKTCASLGATVIMLNRKSERADKALEELRAATGAEARAILVHCDLMSLDGVREAAKELHTVSDGIDVLCNNGGVMGLLDLATGDGFDVQMQTNHLGHFLLTTEIWDLLEAAVSKRGEARVVNHSSGARKKPLKPMTAAYLQRNGGNLGGDGFPGWGKWQRYQQSKLANLLFTYALDDWIKARGSKVKSLCAHPGPAASGLQGKTSVAGGTRMLDNFILNLAQKNAQSVEDGSMGIVRCCCDPSVQSGQFYGPTLPQGKSGMQVGPAEVLPEERDSAAQKLLWDESLNSCGVTDTFV